MFVVYSYSRLSTGEQGEGDGQRRQDDGARAWVARHPGHVLDTALVLRDKGRSGFHGLNAKGKGALARFLALIDAGVVKPGSVLLLESLDRLSRQQIKAARDIIDRILEAGVDIVTFLPEERFTGAGLNDLVQRLKLDLYCQRAHEESLAKSERAKANWSQKRLAIRRGQAVTACRPFWLDILQDEAVVGPGRGKADWKRPVTFQLNAKVEILRHVFNLADPAQGNLGASRIAQDLVARGWRLGRVKAATNETIIRLLRDRRAVGEYQPCHRRDANGHRAPAGEPVPNYYPVAVSVEQFARVQQALKDRLRNQRGRRPAAVPNLFQGIIYDARDGRRMHLRRSHGKHVLTNIGALRKEPGAVWVDYEYARLERAVLGMCRELDPALLRRGADPGLAKAEGELAECKQRIERAQRRLDAAADEAEEEVAASHLARLVRQRKQLEGAVEKARAEASTQPEDQARRLRTLLDALASCPEDERPAMRSKVAALVQCVIKRIYVWVQRKGPRTRAVKRAWVWVEFATGSWRKIFCGLKGNDVSMAYGRESEVNFTVPAGHGWE
jgi:DNA invertase Pin-like site-specific DNA recombinase